jgi:hypothetical protein
MIKKTNPNHTPGFFTARLRRLSPLLLVVLASGLLLAIATISRYLAARGAGSVDARVVIERGDQEPSQIRSPNNAPARLPDGEVYRTADRLRDAAALAYAAALYAVDRQLQRRTPQTAEALTTGMLAARLYPPGIICAEGGALYSDHATLNLRYRAQPLGIEVISIGRAREEGPALMVRVPGEGDRADRGVLFIASKLADSDPPPPFASVRACVDAGWIDEPLRSLDMSDRDRDQLRSWLTSVVSSKH